MGINFELIKMAWVNQYLGLIEHVGLRKHSHNLHSPTYMVRYLMDVFNLLQWLK